MRFHRQSGAQSRRFYRYLDCRALKEEDMTVRSAVQEIALEHGRYDGYRRITAELRRRGMMVNHKRVARIDAASMHRFPWIRDLTRIWRDCGFGCCESR
jgi:hypothetical protein